ncbi:MAG: glycosyltransferase [Actinomycetota bacterium]
MTPSVSVVIVPGNRRERAARALASVLDQDGIERAEVVVLDAANDGSPPLPRSDEPAVRLFSRPQRGTYGELRSEGTRLARAPIVAFIEEHAIALPGWLAAIEESLASAEYCGASGEVHPLNPGAGISDAVALMNYARWLPPLTERGPSSLVVGHNSAYRRDDLLAFGDALEHLLSCEVVLQWQLGARGRRFLINPEIRLAHLNETTLSTICKGYYLWNVSFGAEWANQEAWSSSRRALQALGIPWWVIRRIVDIARTARAPHHRRTLLRHLPVVIVSQVTAALGLAVGATRGDRGHARRFSNYELDQDRGPATAFTT